MLHIPPTKILKRATQNSLLFGKWMFREKEVRRKGQKQKRIRQKEQQDKAEEQERIYIKVGSKRQP